MLHNLFHQLHNIDAYLTITFFDKILSRDLSSLIKNKKINFFNYESTRKTFYFAD